MCAVLKVFPRVDRYTCNLVNLYVLGKTENEKIFDKQVVEFKRLLKLYDPREAVIDINGLGIGFADLMIKETLDPVTGEVYPAYGFFNRDEYEEIQPRNCKKILYGMKANAQINSDMHSALYSKIYSGCVNLLISEKKAKDKLNATKIGMKLTPEQKIARLMPHELTSQFIDEVLNLRVRPTGVSNQIAVEQINKRLTKDKFSAVEMGVYRMVQLESEQTARRRNRGLNRKLVFYTGGDTN